MPTTDSTMTPQSPAVAQPPVQNDEFDLGITQEMPQDAPSAQLSSENVEWDQSFDFSLDLPDTYAEQTPTPVIENAQDQPSTGLLQDTNASEMPSLNAQDETLSADPMPSQEVSDGFLNEESTPFVGVENQQQNPESSEMVSPENNTDFLLEEAPSDQEVPLMMSEEPLQEETAPSPESDFPTNEFLQDELSQTTAQEQHSPEEAGSMFSATWQDIAPVDQESSFQSDLQGEDNISLTDAIPSTENLSPNEISEAKDEAVFLEDALPTANESVPEEVNQDAPSQMFMDASPESEANTQPSEPFMTSDQSAGNQLIQQEQPTEVPPSLSVPAGDGNLLNLDEMLAQSPQNVSNSTSDAAVDPFTAMKETLQAQQQPTQAPTLSPMPETGALNETLQTPSQENLASDPQAQSLNLDMLSAQLPPQIAPLTASSQTPKLTTANLPLKKMLGVVFGAVIVIATGVIAYIRYPDLFSLSAPQGEVSLWTGEEHNAAPENPLLTGEMQTSDDGEIQQTDPVSVSGTFDDDNEDAIQTIDLSQTNTPSTTTNPSTGNAAASGVNNADGLGAIENLVGPVNNNDILKQEVMEFQRKGKEVREMWEAQNKRTMIKYGLAVEKESEKILDRLANGENIDISTWSELKSQLDDYLTKATNG